MNRPLLYLLLVSSVLALIIGPVVLVFVPLGSSALVAGGLLLVYGAIGLWKGMKTLEATPPPTSENEHEEAR